MESIRIKLHQLVDVVVDMGRIDRYDVLHLSPMLVGLAIIGILVYITKGK